MTASMICRHGREASVCFPCSTIVKRPQKASGSSSLGSESAAVQIRVSKSLSNSRLHSEMRDGGSEKPLAAAQQRLGNRGPKPSYSRFARYRRRHPEYVERERVRLERLRARTRDGKRA